MCWWKCLCAQLSVGVSWSTVWPHWPFSSWALIESVIHPHRLKREGGREQWETIPVKMSRHGTCPCFIPRKKQRVMEPGKGGRETTHDGLKASDFDKHCESDSPSRIPNPSSIKTLSKHHMCRVRVCFCCVCMWNRNAFDHSFVASAISNVLRNERLTD